MIPEDEIDRIKRETDLATVIRARGVELKPQGHDLVGLCPFHDDHDPSLRVTPGKGLWRCMSCNATGNVIQFVQRFDGVSFRHAYELLKTGKLSALSGPATGAPLKKSTVPRLESPLTPDADDQAALRQVLDYYHERLKENPDALAYLKKRGISSEAVTTFKLGFVDRTLGLRLPHNNRKEGAALRERLTRLGILRDTGHEHLRGRIVFPVVAETGAIGTVYGRAIDDGGKHDRHLFLPGPQCGVFNPAALRLPEIIVTEGIIDALTFWSAGFRNVTTGYSAKALPDELLDALVAAKVQRVLIAYDRDKAGDEGAAAVAAQLVAYGVECARVLFPHGQDANAYALAVTPAEKSLGLLLRSALPMDEMGKGKVSSHVAPAPSSL
jgi:DNA primase catalytic core